MVETTRSEGGEPRDIRPTEVASRAAVAVTGVREHDCSARVAARRMGVTRRAFLGEAERGETNSRQPPVPTRIHLAPFQEVDVDTIIPGCTRNPLLTGVIGFFMGEGVTLTSSRKEIVQDACRESARLRIGARPRIVVAGFVPAGAGVAR